MNKFDQFMLGFALRVFASWKSTGLGLALAIGGDLLYRLSIDPGAPSYVHLIALAALTPFLAWKDRHIADGTAVKLNLPPGGAALAFALLFLPLAAYAQTPAARSAGAAIAGGEIVTSEAPLKTLADVTPAPAVDPPAASLLGSYGGCFARGLWCVAPTMGVNVGAINLSKMQLEGSFSPGLGVGLTWNRGSWYSLGLAVLINADVKAQNFAVTAGLTLLNGWLRVGYARGIIGDHDSRLPFSVGVL